jgi:hypothetical protein
MGLTNLTRVTETIEGWELQQAPDMISVLDHIGGLGGGATYSGSVQMNNAAGTITWQLLINNTTANSSQFGVQNDWVIIENNAIVTIVKAADYASMFV